MAKYPSNIRYSEHEASEFDLPSKAMLNSDISKVSEVNEMVSPTSYHQSLDQYFLGGRFSDKAQVTKSTLSKTVLH